MPLFIPISWRIGPLTRTMLPIEDMLLWRPVSPLEARARSTGKCSGEAPAITAFTATFSTSKCQNSMPIVGRSLPTNSSGAWLVAREHLPPPVPRSAARSAGSRCPAGSWNSAPISPRVSGSRAAASSGPSRPPRNPRPPAAA